MATRGRRRSRLVHSVAPLALHVRAIPAERGTSGPTASVSGQPRAIARPSRDQQRTPTAAPIRSAARTWRPCSGSSAIGRPDKADRAVLAPPAERRPRPCATCVPDRAASRADQRSQPDSAATLSCAWPDPAHAGKSLRGTGPGRCRGDRLVARLRRCAKRRTPSARCRRPPRSPPRCRRPSVSRPPAGHCGSQRSPSRRSHSWSQ